MPRVGSRTLRSTVVVGGRWATVKECERTILTVDWWRASAGKVTGGMKMAVDGGFATAGFEFMPGRDGIPRGTLQHVDHARGLSLHTKVIEGIDVNTARTDAWIWGRVLIDGTEERFRLHLVDAGEPGRADRYELDVLDLYAVGHGRTIIGGNVQIHRD